MGKTALVLDARYEAHRASAGHPERPERIAALRESLAAGRREGLLRIEPRPATREELLANHSRAFVDMVEATAGRPFHRFDPDTQASSMTYETARLAAGGLLAVLDAIMDGRADNGFALVRPPGHHAEADRAMGFCFFNHVAIGARYLRDVCGLRRVLIVDWDVHHGNGTQRSFYADKSVMYISTHQYPYYPGTGAADEVGVADGAGYTVNLPFPAGFGDAEYAEAFHRIVGPASRQFDPDFLLISAGFDCHRVDPIAGMNVTAKGFAAMTRSLLAVARDHACGRCAAVLEGGYSLDGLRDGVASVLDEMGRARPHETPEDPSGEVPELPLDEAPVEPSDDTHEEPWDEAHDAPRDEAPEEPTSSRAGEVISEVARIHGRFWRL